MYGRSFSLYIKNKSTMNPIQDRTHRAFPLSCACLLHLQVGFYAFPLEGPLSLDDTDRPYGGHNGVGYFYHDPHGNRSFRSQVLKTEGTIYRTDNAD